MSIAQRPLSRDGRQVSMLGFGLMRLPWIGQSHVNIDYDRASAMVHRAVEGGVDYFDTAWAYHGPKGALEKGASEPFFGRVLSESPGLRDRVKIATKMPVWLVTKRADLDRFLNEQLERLRTDHLDFYLAHGLNEGGWARAQRFDLLEFLVKAREDGRIGSIGFSFHDEFPLFEEILGNFDWDFCQIQYNYLDRDFQAGEAGLKLAHRRGLGVAVMEPLRGGSLVNHLPAEAERILAEARPDWSPADWALRWLWSQAEVSTVLSGMNTLEQVDDNLRIARAAASEPFGEREKAAVGEVETLFRQRLKAPCTGCGYCRACPAGVDIVRNFLYFNKFHLFDNLGTRRQSWLFYLAQVPPEARADQCTDCGACRERCPQGLPISDFMKEIAAWAEREAVRT